MPKNVVVRKKGWISKPASADQTGKVSIVRVVDGKVEFLRSGDSGSFRETDKTKVSNRHTTKARSEIMVTPHHGTTRHVIFREGSWGVKTEKGKSFRVYDTKQEAIDAARERVRDGGELVVHGRDGQIISKDTLGATISEDRIRHAVRAVRNRQISAKKT
jgi:hypothetical protein